MTLTSEDVFSREQCQYDVFEEPSSDQQVIFFC